jgi:hypothetical protein
MRRQLRGANSSTTGLVYLGLSRKHPCGTLFQTIAVLVRHLDEKSNGRTTPQYECWCNGRASILHRRGREEVLGRPMWGKRTKSRMCLLNTDMRTIQGQAAFGHNVQTIIIKIEFDIVYNMYYVKPDVVSLPSQLCHAGNLQVMARP